MSENKPVLVTQTLPLHPVPRGVKRRIVTLGPGEFYLTGTYVINSTLR